MSAHKFSVGQHVRLLPRISSLVRNQKPDFEVLRLLPAEGGHNQYRLKNAHDNQERVAKEFELVEG